MTYTIGLLHPGSMGSVFGAQLRACGHIVLWCPEGRSDTTRRRAEHADLLVIAAKRTRSYLVETDYIPKAAARAWRWGPELEDAAALLADAGLPDSLMQAAAATLARWENHRDERLDIAEALEALRGEQDSKNPR